MSVTYSVNRKKAEAEKWRDSVTEKGTVRVIATHANAPADEYACAEYKLSDFTKAELLIHAHKSLVIATQAAARVHAGWQKQSKRAAKNRANADLIAALGGVERAAEIAQLPAGEMQAAIEAAKAATLRAQRENAK